MRIRTAMIWISLATLGACGGLRGKSQPSLEAASWVKLHSGTQASLRGLSVVDEAVIWASGSEGTVLRSLDGGARWERLAVHGAEAMDFRDVHAFDAEIAIVMSITKPACLLRTQDGGGSWERVYESPLEAEFFDSLTFFDDRRGCLFGDPQGGVFAVLCSDDGGASWTRVPAGNLPAAREGEAAFAASGTCISSLPGGLAWIGTGGESARVLRSSDYGHSWQAAETPVIRGGTSGIYSVAFQDAMRGVVVGGDFSKPELAERNVALTKDGGLTWVAIDAAQLVGGYRSAVAHVPGRQAAWVAVGRAGCDYSVDGGASWQALGSQGYYALGFGPRGSGFAVGSGGRIAKLRYWN